MEGIFEAQAIIIYWLIVEIMRYYLLSISELDVTFLKNCQSFNVVAKFLCFNLPNNNTDDIESIGKKLLKSALKKIIKEKNMLNSEYDKYRKKLWMFYLIWIGIPYFPQISRDINFRAEEVREN